MAATASAGGVGGRRAAKITTVVRRPIDVRARHLPGSSTRFGRSVGGRWGRPSPPPEGACSTVGADLVSARAGQAASAGSEVRRSGQRSARGSIRAPGNRIGLASPCHRRPPQGSPAQGRPGFGHVWTGEPRTWPPPRSSLRGSARPDRLPRTRPWPARPPRGRRPAGDWPATVRLIARASRPGSPGRWSPACAHPACTPRIDGEAERFLRTSLRPARTITPKSSGPGPTTTTSPVRSPASKASPWRRMNNLPGADIQGLRFRSECR